MDADNGDDEDGDDGLADVVDNVGIGAEDVLYSLDEDAVGVADDPSLPALPTLLLNVGDVGWSRVRRFRSRSSLTSRDGAAPSESARFLIRSWRSSSISARLIPKIAAGEEGALSTTAT